MRTLRTDELAAVSGGTFKWLSWKWCKPAPKPQPKPQPKPRHKC